jgi:membrane fusion protein (multidrug efflux system)
MALLLAAMLGLSMACGMANGADGEKSDNGEEQATPAENRDDADAEEAEGDDEEQAKALPVEVSPLATGSIESVLKFSSTLEAEREIKVFAEAARLVRDLLVEEGDQVRKGQVLVRLQDEEQRNALSKTRNELAKAEREYKRQQRLHAESLISEEEFNNATFELDQLRIAVQDAERELSYTEVKAPISGTITQRMVNLGDQVQIGQHLFDIIDFNSLVALIYVPEKHLPELNPGQTARLSARATGGDDYRGRVKRIAPIVDSRSGTVKVTIDVGGQRALRPGMYVDVDLVTATLSDAVLVPKRAIVYDNDQMFVFRMGKDDDDRLVERVFIVPALSDKINVQPAGGVAEGDLIVVAGQAGLKDGARVKLPGDDDDEEDAEDDTEVLEESSAEATVAKAAA